MDWTHPSKTIDQCYAAKPRDTWWRDGMAETRKDEPHARDKLLRLWPRFEMRGELLYINGLCSSLDGSKAGMMIMLMKMMFPH